MIAFCKDNWKLVDKQEVDFYKVKYQYSRGQEDFKKTNKALLILLEHRQSSKKLVVANMQLYHGKQHDYVRQAQALYFLEQASLFIRKHAKPPKQVGKTKRAWEMPIPFVLGCDLESRPDDAAFDVLIGKDIFDKSTPWRMPVGETAESLELYGLIEANFRKLLAAGKLDPLVYNLESAYTTAVYHGGMHTSRAPTCYSKGRQGMFDHIMFNSNKLQVSRILEIPAEQDLAPARCGDVKQPQNMVCLLPNSVFPSTHLRLEVEFEIRGRDKRETETGEMPAVEEGIMG